MLNSLQWKKKMVTAIQFYPNLLLTQNLLSKIAKIEESEKKMKNSFTTKHFTSHYLCEVTIPDVGLHFT